MSVWKSLASSFYQWCHQLLTAIDCIEWLCASMWRQLLNSLELTASLRWTQQCGLTCRKSHMSNRFIFGWHFILLQTWNNNPYLITSDWYKRTLKNSRFANTEINTNKSTPGMKNTNSGFRWVISRRLFRWTVYGAKPIQWHKRKTGKVASVISIAFQTIMMIDRTPCWD